MCTVKCVLGAVCTVKCVLEKKRMELIDLQKRLLLERHGKFMEVMDVLQSSINIQLPAVYGDTSTSGSHGNDSSLLMAANIVGQTFDILNKNEEI